MPRDGVSPSRVQLVDGDWDSALDALAGMFPSVGRETWRTRIARGDVSTADGTALAPGAPFQAGLVLHYFREIVDEPPVPFDEIEVHADAHLLVVDKPHFLAVVPAGRHVRETLLARLVRRTGNTALVPLHRLD
ncbi:MAG TPA: pseudouridine synthase, partial [Luteimonas sp.]|nr:pseudouridine synthase [Luteimonas sp.]